MIRLSHIAAPAVVASALFLGVGCASDDHHPSDVPLNAQDVGIGREKVTYQAPHDGTVYVYDDTAHKMVYSGKIDKGQQVQLDAKKNEVLIDNNVATKEDLINDHKYRVFFEKADTDKAQPAGQTINIQPSDQSQPRTTINTPGASVSTPNNTTVTVPPANNSNTTVTVPAPGSSGTSSGTTTGGQTTVTTPNGTVIHEK